MARTLKQVDAWINAHVINHVTTGHPTTQAGVHGHPHPASAADGLTVAEVTKLRALIAAPPTPHKPSAPTSLRATKGDRSVALAWA